MATNNDITRRMITTAIKPTTDAYRKGWERIFAKKFDGDLEYPVVKKEEPRLKIVYRGSQYWVHIHYKNTDGIRGPFPTREAAEVWIEDF